MFAKVSIGKDVSRFRLYTVAARTDDYEGDFRAIDVASLAASSFRSPPRTRNLQDLRCYL